MTGGDFRTLALVARALCEDTGIRIEPSSGGWAWDPVRRAILVDLADLARHGVESCAGIIAHEAGHARVTRGALAPGPDLPGALAHGLHNAVEDPRCEAWIADRFEGTQRWLDAARRAHRGDVGRLPLHLQFVVGAADPASLEAPMGPAGADPRVVEALVATRPARIAARDTRPSAELDAWTDARPRLRGEAVAIRRERSDAAIHDAAAAAAGIVDEHVRATYAALVDDDARLLARAIAGMSTEDLALAMRGDWSTVRLRAANGAEPDASAVARARAFLEAIARRLCRRPGGIGRAVAGLAAGPSVPGTESTDEDGGRRTRVAADAARLTACLERVFPSRKATWSRRRHESGQRPHLGAAMRLEADPRASLAVWERRRSRGARSAAVLLLVDLSGSMRGRAIEGTLDAVVMLDIALRRLAIPFAVFGFQDELIPISPFARCAAGPGDAGVRRMALEVAGTAPGGHNHPGFNDDGPCLNAAAALLAQRRETDRLLVVLSDGEPAGCHSQPADLERAVARWSGPQSPVQLVGVGIDSAAVARYYPDAVAGVKPAELPRRLAEVVARRYSQRVGSKPAA